jgi:outer membrane protein
LQAQVQRDSRDGLTNTRNDWRLTLSVPLWDGGVLAAGRDAAQARRLAAEATVQAAEREQRRELATQGERLQAAREQYATAEGALAAAAQTVAAMRVGQEQGSRSTGDVLLALQTESQLRQLLLIAQSNAWLAWIDALVAQGRFDDNALIALNNVLERK